MTNDTQISEREIEILRLVATGATNQQIAQQLNISINTVKVHLRNIFGKIGAVSRTEATIYAIRNGFVAVGDKNIDLSLSAAPSLPESGDTVTTNINLSLSAAPSLPDSIDTLSTNVETPFTDIQPVAESSSPQNEPATQTLGRHPVPYPLWAGIIGLLLIIGLALVGVFSTMPSALSPTVLPVTSPFAIETRWRNLAPLPSGRAGFGLVSYIYEGRTYLYAIGGRGADGINGQVARYDPETNTWVPFSTKPTPVGDIQAVGLAGRIYIPGGNTATGISNTFEAYDPRRDQWISLRPLPQPRSGYMLAIVEGKIYLFGGWDGTTYHNTVWRYDPDNDSWSERQPMSTPRAFGGIIVHEGQVFIFGGVNQNGSLNINERYIPSDEDNGENPWTKRATVPAVNGKVTAANTGGLAFLISKDKDTSHLLVYNIAQDSWEQQETPLPALVDLRTQFIDNKLYIVGGYDGTRYSEQAYAYQVIYTVVLPSVTNQ